MDIRFDPAKRAKTLEARGLDFADAGLVFMGEVATDQAIRRDYGEDRFVTAGYLNGRMVVLVWTPRDGARHVISMRYAMAEKKKPGAAEWVDPDDAPELTDAFFDRAEVWHGDTFVRRGPGRPKSAAPKEQISVRLDPDVMAKLREAGPGWQSQVNALLRQALRLDKREHAA
jgi:uncharacterized protein (DUF4415 family)